MEEITKKQYIGEFRVEENVEKGIHDNALKNALDIRKFEIELYWKRATYFWTFIGAAFVGYVALANNPSAPASLLFLLNCLGFSFSLCWFLVNKGSKFWQNNWERHVDMLEDNINGELYKTVIIDKNVSRWIPYMEYPFSVSKINQMLSGFLVVMWFLLGISTVFWQITKLVLKEKIYFLDYTEILGSIALLIVTAGFSRILFKYGKTTEIAAACEQKRVWLENQVILRRKHPLRNRNKNKG